MSAKTITKMAVAMFLVGGAVAVAASGCGTSSGSFCNKICDCTGCSEIERSDCVDTVDDAKKAAGDEGCNDQYNAYFSCVDSELACNAGVVEADGCDAEVEALDTCMGGTFIGIGVNACVAVANKMIAKLESCGIEVSGGGTNPDAECTTQDAKTLKCYWVCYDAVSCAVLNGNESDPAFVDCLSACQ